MLPLVLPRGVQLAMYNRTRDELSGFQLGATNFAYNIEGKNSIMETESTGIQIGIVNYSKTMNGFQIGLVNLTHLCHGTQIGLVNVFNSVTVKGKLNGTPIGLLNIGGAMSLEAFIDESFQMNYAIRD